jgi:hypothetical protein
VVGEAQQLTPRRPHRPLKRFTFQRDTAFQLALRLTMRRILATLAVIALLFSAGSAWADFDDGWAAFERGDYATALRVFRPLAEQGDSASQFTLAGMYIKGWGVPKNNAEGVKLYRKAAEQGLSPAQFILGIYHYIDLGVGVPRDNVLAHMWLSLAAKQGHEAAQEYIPKLESKMPSSQIAKAQELAAEWWEEHNN